MLSERWRLALRHRLAGGGGKPPQGGWTKEVWSEAFGEKAYLIRQVGCAETNASEPLMRCRNYILDDVESRVLAWHGDEFSREPVYWLSGIRHKDGVTARQAFGRNRRTCRPGVKGELQAEVLQEAEYRYRAQGRNNP
jgi:hypothetical protein